MKKTAAVFFLLFLLATAYSQVAVLQLAISDPLLFKNGMIRKGLSMQTTIRETTFSKPHTYAFAAGKSTQHPVRQGRLWGGIAGAALGVTLVLAGNSDPAYRP